MNLSSPRTALALTLSVPALITTSEARARPEAPATICGLMPEARVCVGRVPTCAICHDSTDPPTWNAFGQSLLEPFGSDADADYVVRLASALAATGRDDIDGDGVSNLAELYAGSSPADPDIAWCEAVEGAESSPTEPDLPRTYQRIESLFCGGLPTYETLAELSELSTEAARERVHLRLDECLSSRFWSQVALPRLADEKIRPVYVYGPQSEADVALANYAWDYRLFIYVLTGSRDARDMLLARYHVDDDGQGGLIPVEGIVGPDIEPQRFGFPGGQPLEPEHRAGMLTAQWFLVSNTFLSDIPRGTAANAYRAFLDLDIARLEGIRPVDGEPLDLDDREVDAPACAQCHSTLDPLSYAFVAYEGVPSGPGQVPGTYNPLRPYTVLGDWPDPPSEIFGQRVTTVREWAEVAANHDAFARMLGRMFFRYTHDRPEAVHEQAPLEACWRSLPEWDYSADALLHCIVDLPSFSAGAPR